MHWIRNLSQLGSLTLLVLWHSPVAVAFNARATYDFESDGNAEGWGASNAVATVAGGYLSCSATAIDPQLFRTGPVFPGNASTGLLVRLRGSANGNVELFWGRQGDDNYKAERRIFRPYTGNGEWQTLFLSPRGHDQWDGQTITRLRVDPPGTSGDSFEIDWIRVLVWDYDNDGWRDDVEGAGDTDGDGLLDLEDLDSDNDGVSDAWEREILNAPGSVHFNFDTDGDAEGWAANSSFLVQEIASGRLTGSVAGGDPNLSRARLHLQAGLIDGMAVRLAVSQAGSITLFWANDANNNFSGTRSITLPVPQNNEGVTVYFDLREAAGWKGELITQLRLDPDFPQGSTVAFDWIRTSDGDYDRDGLADMVEGSGDIDGDGLAHFEDPDSDGDGVSDSEEQRRGWEVLNAIEASRDSDGDGGSDASESVARTDPGNADDRFHLDAGSSLSGIELQVDGRSGRSYELQESGDFTSWSGSAMVPPLGEDGPVSWTVGAGAPSGRMFFRTQVSGAMENPVSFPGGAPTDEVGPSEDPFLDNGVLRLGAAYQEGASIDFLVAAGGGNLVNIADQGRLIQQSYYAGASLDRTAEGQSTHWSPWPWNPIQGGDASGKEAEVLEVGVSGFGAGFFSRTVPLLWDMTTGEKGQALMDQWNRFEEGMPHVVQVTCRLICERDSGDIWGGAVPRHQELPAVYLIRSLSKTVTYQGAAPWTNAATEQVATPGPPWGKYHPTEGWVAMVDPATDVGAGLYSPIGTTLWNVGATGSPPGGPTSGATMHMAPVRTMKLDRDSIMVYRYWLIYGDLATIRSTIYSLHDRYPDG